MLINLPTLGRYTETVSLLLRRQVKEDAEKVAQNLKKEIRGCAALVLWLDCDDEGENIAQEVVDVCAPAARRGLRMYVTLADNG